MADQNTGTNSFNFTKMSETAEDVWFRERAEQVILFSLLSCCGGCACWIRVLLLKLELALQADAGLHDACCVVCWYCMVCFRCCFIVLVILAVVLYLVTVLFFIGFFLIETQLRMQNVLSAHSGRLCFNTSSGVDILASMFKHPRCTPECLCSIAPTRYPPFFYGVMANLKLSIS